MSHPALHYFGIRHHGPGSARRLLAALEQIKPSLILLEGPADCSLLFPELARDAMQPPVALLSYVAAQPTISLYYPFADYSPEYQVCCWADRHQVPVECIDLPIAVRLAQLLAEDARAAADKAEETQEVEDITPGGQTVPGCQLSADPIGVLAQLAGYEDGEAWWNDLIEQNSDDDQALFSSLEQAMAELRSAALAAEQNEMDPVFARDFPREAHMRLAIAKAAKASQGPVAVVCGAWHVPALREKHPAKEDRALLKSLPAKLAPSKVKSTWIPWTSPRLAQASGYGAGVQAPMWYQHLWQHHDNRHSLILWLGGITRVMRAQGQVISTASVIEAVRLSRSLAAVRGRPAPGFEEIREAVVACLCFGETLLWQQLERQVLLGNAVGQIPPDAPLVPLLEDLQQQQKKNKLKPEALPRELSLDLRSQAGAGKSILLHRLQILQVPWGQLSDSGGSRGTFRERWRLVWEPEFSVRLVEALVYGSTIEQAAAGKMSETLAQTQNLGALAETVQLCLAARLDTAAALGIARLDEQAALASDCRELLASLPPLVTIARYGTARDISLDQVQTLTVRLAKQAAIALPYGCRNLNDEESSHYCTSLGAAHQALLLAEMEAEAVNTWWLALAQVLATPTASLQVAGLCARLLYQEQKLEAQRLQRLFHKMLSPAIPAADAARFFEGFFAEAIGRLLYDAVLLAAVEDWLLGLSDEEFIEFLPLFRRLFAELDAMERRHLIETVLQGRGRAQTQGKKTVSPAVAALWPDHLQRLGRLIKGEKEWHR